MIRNRYSKIDRVAVDCLKGVNEKGRLPNGSLAVLTKQHFKDSVNVNNIMRKYMKTGVLTHVRDSAQALEGDFSNVVDYQGALNLVISANSLFAQLPSKLRERFGNDASRFLAFVDDPKNQDELIKLGLATRRPDSPMDGANPPTPTPSQPISKEAAGGQPGAPAPASKG